MTRRTRNPVSSFGPEMLALLVKGSRERVEVRLNSHREAAYMQLRLQTLRGAMRREKHPQLSIVERARTSRQWDKDTAGRPTNFRLVIEPQDSRFLSAIKQAGITVEEVSLSDDMLDADAAPPTPVDPSTQPALVDPSLAPGEDPYSKFK